jgi:post-segregation antitoxin (ccd killing protein)
MRKTQLATFSLSKSVANELRTLSEEMNLNRSAFANDAIKRALRNYKRKNPAINSEE